MKNLMKKMFLLLLVIFSFQQASNAQEKTDTIKIHFDGKDYKNLELIIVMDDGSRKHFEGQSENGKDWTFKYPDSIYNMHKFMRIGVPSNVDTVSEDIKFKTLINRNSAGSYNFKQGISNVKAVYLKSGILNHKPFVSEVRDAVVYKTIHFDEFFVEPQSDQELLSSIEDILSGYSLFDNYNPNQLSYEGQLESYINLTKKYPDSYSLVYKLATCLTFYSSKPDVEKVYNCFSDKIKKTYRGEKIEHFIKNNTFINSVLPVWDSERSEPIIKDISKYNFIVFSASWCAPCHKLIPVLKEVYNDLRGKLDLVYVSLDEPKTVENWKILMKKDQIPWRSVLAIKDVKGITAKYTAQTIPLSLLVHPNGYTEIIDIRKKEDNDKLYRLVRQ
jgi:thiol-disulfide isomerase/thioredoxin